MKDQKIGIRRENSPYTEAECRLIIQQLGEYLDGELDNIDLEKMERKLQTCSYCMEQYEIEKQYHEFVKSKLDLHKKNEDIENHIMQMFKFD